MQSHYVALPYIILNNDYIILYNDVIISVRAGVHNDRQETVVKRLRFSDFRAASTKALDV